MKHTLDGAAAEGPSFIDFTKQGGRGRAGSFQAECGRFLDAMKCFVAQRCTDDVIQVSEMYAVGEFAQQGSGWWVDAAVGSEQM